jgi:signal transduction histidine kinase/ligand-binding sensor domain-containing protein/CheY-like chemotaxis protein
MDTGDNKWASTGAMVGRMVITALVFLHIFLPSHLYPHLEDKKFHRLTTENGLCNDSVFSIIQDRQGFIWIGTLNGLTRYDGSRFVTFYHEPLDPNSLSISNFGKLLEDRNGTLWLATWGGGLNRYDRETGHFIRYQYNPSKPGSIAGNFLTAVIEDKKGNLWIGISRYGFDMYDVQKKRFIHHKHDPDDPNSLSDNRVRDICEDRQGNLWIGTYGGGVNRFNPQTGKFTRFMSDPRDPRTISHYDVRTIYCDSSGIIWIGTHGGGLNRLDPRTGEINRYPHDPDHPGRIASNINWIFQDSRGFLWIGNYSKGLNRFDPVSGNLESFRHSEQNIFSLANGRIETLYEDRSGVLWIGTRGGGISTLDLKPPKFKQWHHEYSTVEGVYSQDTNTITEDKAGNLWIGTEGGGIDRMIYDSKKGTTTFKNYRPDPAVFDNLSHSRIRYLLEDRTGTFWVGTFSGLKILDRATGKFSLVKLKMAYGSREILENGIIVIIYEDRDSTIWIGTANGLYKLLRSGDGYTASYCPFKPEKSSGSSSNYISAVYQESAGKLWFGSNHGLHMLKTRGAPPELINYTRDPANPGSLSNNNVTAIYEDRTGRFWVGTLGGLNKLDRESGSISFYLKKDGLSNNVIHGILEDNNGRLWISTGGGLSRFDPETGEFRNYGVHDGLRSSDFNTRALFKCKSGEMFFGSSRGVISFFPDQVRDNPYIPQVVLTTIRIRGRESDIDPAHLADKPLQLYYRENSFSFEFAALDYTNPGMNHYAYKLEGFDKKWKQNGTRRFAEYTNIPAGEYTLKVIGSNNDRVWNNTGTSLRIRIIPAFWMTTWFYGIVLCLVLFILFFFYRLRTRRVRSYRRKLEKLVEKRTQQLKTANEIAEHERELAQAASRSKSEFLARMSHEIRTPLNSIIGFNEILLETKLNFRQMDYVKTIKQSGEALLGLIDEILDFSRIEAGQLTLESVDFDPGTLAYDVCHLVKPRIEDRPIEILCDVGERVPDFVIGDPGKFRQVLVNLLGNAVKFTQEGEIQLSMDIVEDAGERVEMKVSVRDTGIGIEEEKLENIFEAFRQADGFTNRKYGGSGLGLTISRQIARLMEGDLRVESRPGKGSTFYFDCRFKKSLKKSEQHTDRDLENRRILLVDDNINSLDIIRRRLNSRELQVTALVDSRETLTILEQAVTMSRPFDICILDSDMPHMSGHDVAGQIRKASAPIASIPLLALSGTERNDHRFARSGFDAFLPKPPYPGKLVEMMQQLLDKSAHPGENLSGAEAGDRSDPETSEVVLADISAGHILVAEDHPINQKLIRHILDKSGYLIDLVENGEDALQMYTSEPGKYSLILMDIQMPKMNGIEATIEIRNWEKKNLDSFANLTGVPIIALTAQTIKGDREKCLEAGMDDFIPKPIKRELLLSVIEKWAFRD